MARFLFYIVSKSTGMKNFLRIGSEQVYLALMTGFIVGMLSVVVQNHGNMAHHRSSHMGLGQWLYQYYGTIPHQAHNLLNVEWVITRIGEEDIHLAAQDKPLTLKLERESGRFVTYDGCSVASGAYRTNGKKFLKLECDIEAATACDRQQQRMAYLDALKRVDGFIQQGDLLILMQGKDPLLTLTPAYLAEPTVKQVSN